MVAQIDAEVICGGVPGSQLSVGGIGEIFPGVGGSHVSLRYGYFQHQLIEEVDVICSLCGISRACAKAHASEGVFCPCPAFFRLADVVRGKQNLHANERVRVVKSNATPESSPNSH